MTVKRLVLDVLKPHSPSLVQLANELADREGVSGVNATLLEQDKKVENVKLTVEGENVDYDDVKETVEALSGTVHSVDEVASGDRLVEESETPQD